VVEDTRPLLARAAAFVAPLRIGSGTRIKILEAAAMAKAIVSTTLGAEGLELSNGNEILLADEPQRFARAVADLLLDPGRRRALGRAARRRVAENYSLLVLRHALRGAFTELC
jgi:glycosyltransferase involved in cell wall biosynthesis